MLNGLQLPTTRPKFRYWMLGSLAIGTVLFLTLYLPFTLLLQRKVAAYTEVVGRVSDHRVVGNHPTKSFVRATVEFDRPTPEGGRLRCRVERVMGAPSDPGAYVKEMTLAVRNDSCGDAKRLPLREPQTLRNWLQAYMEAMLMAMGIGLIVFVVTHPRYLAPRSRAARWNGWPGHRPQNPPHQVL